MKINELLEGRAGVAQAQSKKAIKKLRSSNDMEERGHYHKKGGDWEDISDFKPKKAKKMKVTELLDESTIAHYDEKSRQREAKILTAAKLVKKINDSSLPQDVADKVAKAARSFNGEISKLDVKDILRLAGLSAADKDEIMDML